MCRNFGMNLKPYFIRCSFFFFFNYNYIFLHSCKVRAHVKEAAWQPVCWGPEAPEVPGECELWEHRLHCSVLTHGGRCVWQRRGGRWGRPEPLLQQRGLKLHPEWPRRHCGAARPVRPATNPRGGQRVLQPGAARWRRGQHGQHLQLIIRFILFLIPVQSEFPAADDTGRPWQQWDSAHACTLTARQSARWLLNSRPR